ncbi:hypothetical protein C1H46_008701 [Malus baccata]|uniref:Uncharacterized protein n=1 Tax=Malus baccata TaxID=106549 RepID=A0A540N3Q7_MALBA|nr:hypothetical protein C1H46_008701 [Malus baccata]
MCAIILPHGRLFMEEVLPSGADGDDTIDLGKLRNRHGAPRYVRLHQSSVAGDIHASMSQKKDKYLANFFPWQSETLIESRHLIQRCLYSCC